MAGKPTNPIRNPMDLAALAAAGERGPQALEAQAAQQEQALLRNTRGLELLTQALASQAGQSFVGRMAVQGMDAAAFRARAAAATTTATRASLASPVGQRAYLETGRQQDKSDAAQAQLQREQAGLDARRMATPEYRSAAFERAAATGAESLAQQSAAKVQARAQLAYLSTSAGEKQYAATGRQQDFAASAGSMLQRRQAELEGQRQRTPGYQAAAFNRAAAASAEGLNQLRAAAVNAGAKLDHLRTPEGQKQYAEQGRQQDVAAAADAQTRQRMAAMDASRQRTPEYQQSTAQRAAADSMESLNQLRARVAYQRAETERARTPEGRAEQQERAGLERQARQHEQAGGGVGGVEFQVIAMNLARALPMGLGRIVNATAAAKPMMEAAANPELSSATRAAAALGAVVPVAVAVVGVFKEAASTVYRFAAAASPAAASTFNSSLDLLSAKVGHVAVPALNAMSLAAQQAGQAWDQFASRPTGLGGSSGTAGGMLGNFFQGAVSGSPLGAGAAAASGQRAWPGAATDIALALGTLGLGGAGYSALSGGTSPGQDFNKWLGYKDTDSMSHNLDPRLRPHQYSDFNDYGQQLQQAGLAATGNQTEAQAMKEQMKELTGVTSDMRDITSDIRRILKNYA